MHKDTEIFYKHPQATGIFNVLIILCAAWFCALPVRAYISIEQKINPPALLPVRAFTSYLLFPYGEQEKSGIRVSIDMVPQQGIHKIGSA
jgi:hypothetical protein